MYIINKLRGVNPIDPSKYITDYIPMTIEKINAPSKQNIRLYFHLNENTKHILD